MVILTVFDVDSTWTGSATGAALGVVGAVMHVFGTSRLDRREQDKAVAEIQLKATLPAKTVTHSAPTAEAARSRR